MTAPLQAVDIHIVDDDADVRDGLAWLFDSRGYQSRTWDSGAALLEAARQRQGDWGLAVVLLDVRMGAFHGPDLYGDLCARWQQHPLVVLVTAERDTALRRQAAERGWGFLLKPVRPSALRALISQMLLRQSEAEPSDTGKLQN